MAKKTFERGDRVQFKLLWTGIWLDGIYDQPDNKVGWHWIIDDQGRGYYVPTRRLKKL
jgi:hypothetical protein